MKRVGGLFEWIYEIENLRFATARAMRGKRARREVQEFVAALDLNLARLSRDIAHGTVAVGAFEQFVIHDPKRRIISAPSFRERVLHHAIMNVCEAAFESFAIHDSYACRIGGGQFAALDRAIYFARRCRFFLQLDVKSYFDSIPKDVLLAKLERRFRERELLDLMTRIVRSFEPERDRGLPIGALTSQHFANFYLGYLDHFVKESLGVKGYVRYMDDFALWHNDREVLAAMAREIETFASEELGLTLKPPRIQQVGVGMDFLGHRVHREGNRLNRRSRRRFKLKVDSIDKNLRCGDLSEAEAQERLTAAVAFTRHAACTNWRRGVCFPSGSRPETAPTA